MTFDEWLDTGSAKIMKVPHTIREEIAYFFTEQRDRSLVESFMKQAWYKA